MTYTNRRLSMPVEARTLPGRYYTDPAHFRAEVERIYLDMWLWAGRAEDIPAAGDYFLFEPGTESVVVVRDKNGTVRAYHILCRHRGTRLCRAVTGRVMGKLRCPYHAWTYALDDGRLLAAPHMHRTASFDRRGYGLRPVAVGVWDGHIFLHLGAAPPPLCEHLGDLAERFRPWRMEELVRAHRVVYQLAANWKLVIQNYSECLHCPIIHPRLQDLSHYLSGENEPPRPTYLGGRMKLRDGITSLTVDGTSPWAPLPGLGAGERRQVHYYSLLPNLLLNLHPDYMMTFQLVPHAPDRTDVVCSWYFHPDEIARPGFDPTPAVEFWDLTNRQDWEVSEDAQRGISSRAYTPGPYSNREELLYALDRFMLERVGEPAAV